MSHVLTAIAPASSGGHHHSSPIGFILVGIVFVLVGGLNLIKPGFNFRMNRWQYKNKEAWEPSNAALVVSRISGGVAVIVGIVLIVVGATR